jgi:hypothetical protein
VSPTQRTLKLLREEGCLAQVVERYNPYARVRQDLFGFIDVLALYPDGRCLGAQCTTRANQAARLSKALALPALRTWLSCGLLFEVWGWAKVGKRGQRKTWQVTRRPVTTADLPNAKE